MSVTVDRCVCGHTRYMHNPQEGDRCCVGDHLMLVCTCKQFSQADPQTYAESGAERHPYCTRCGYPHPKGHCTR